MARPAPRRRDPNGPWFRLGTVDITTSAIVASIFGFSVLVFGVKPSFLQHFWFISEEVKRGQLWRLVTWPLALAGDPSVFDFLTAAMFWYFGGQIERELGRTRHLIYLGVLTVVPALVATPVGFAEGGLRYLELFVLVGWALEHRHAKFFGVIPAPALAGVFVLVELIRFSGHNVLGGVVFVLFGALLSPLLLRNFGMLRDLPQIPLIPGLAALGRPRSRRTSGRGATGTVTPIGRRARRDAKSSSAPGVLTPGPWPTGPISQGEVDRLLDKINTTGIDSLSDEERRLLDDASRRLRDRRDG